MSPKHKSNTTSDSDVLKRSCKNIPLSEKVKVFYLIRKKRNCMQRLLKSRSELICEIVKTEKEIHASFAVAPQTTKVMSTVCDKCLVKMEKAWNVYNKMFWESKNQIHITFIMVYCYNCSILLLIIIVNLLLCLLYKLNFIIGMYICIEERHSIHRVWYYAWFPAISEGVGMYHCWIKDYSSTWQWSNFIEWLKVILMEFLSWHSG